jgi:hypothetical protein
VLAVQAAEMMAAGAAERKREGQKAGAASTNAKKSGKALEPPKGAKPKRADKSTARAAKAVGVGKNQVESMAAVTKHNGPRPMTNPGPVPAKPIPGDHYPKLERSSTLSLMCSLTRALERGRNW